MKNKIDFEKVRMYLTDYSDKDYFGCYVEGKGHYFRYRDSDKNWKIVPFESEEWDSLDQNAWNGKDIEKQITEQSEIPDWLPDIPTLEEVDSVDYVDWKDNFNTSDFRESKQYPNLKKYFEDNNITEKKVFFALTEDTYESTFGDGIFRYLKRVSFDKDQIQSFVERCPGKTENYYGRAGFFKEHKIKFNDDNFYMLDFDPDRFEHYKMESLFSVLEDKLNPNSDKFYMNTKDIQKIYKLTPDGKVYLETSGNIYSLVWELTDLTEDDFDQNDYEFLTEQELRENIDV
jgi:hypothetical protein